MKYLLFVGAGTEIGYHLPSGSDYVLKSILTKRDEMYKELKTYYFERYLGNNMVSHKSEYILESKNDLVLNHIVRKSVWDLVKEQEKGNIKKGEIEELKRINEMEILFNYVSNLVAEKDSIDDLNDTQRNKLKDKTKLFIDKYYSAIVDSDNNRNDNSQNDLVLLKKQFQYHGRVEQYFSTIINPKTIGPNNFWKLINYFLMVYNKT